MPKRVKDFKYFEETSINQFFQTSTFFYGRLQVFKNIGNLTGHFFGTECWIPLKPGFKFKFFHCLEVYLKQLQFWTLKGP